VSRVHPRTPCEETTGQLTTAEVLAFALVAASVAAMAASYLLDRVGAGISPRLVLLLSLACGASLAWAAGRSARHDTGDLVAFAGVVLGVLAALIWLAWPELLPIGGGSDLTHHLQLIDFIERHWRLPHSPADALLVGNMINYTPGSHLLAALAGAWAGGDGLHAVHPMLAVLTAIKAGIVLLIVLRILGQASDLASVRTPIALAGVLLLFLPYDYFAGAFARFSFIAQVISEMFAVAMWLALLLWDERKSALAAALFGTSGAGVFLTWPVWVGPPILVLLLLTAIAPDCPLLTRLRHLAIALVPIAVIAALHGSGRIGSVVIVQSGGATFWPSVPRFGWPFLALSAAGAVLAIRDRRSRATTLLLGAIALQAIALAAVARAGRADSPYMALKMAHLAIYPMAAVAALAVSAAWRALVRGADALLPRGWLTSGRLAAVAWALAIATGVATAARFMSVPRPEPAITEDVYRAGRWAHDHEQPDCVEYLVLHDSTSYWLHHAVLGNPSVSPAGAVPVFVYRAALVRALHGQACPWRLLT
jgi:hypothetical protein